MLFARPQPSPRLRVLSVVITEEEWASLCFSVMSPSRHDRGWGHRAAAGKTRSPPGRAEPRLTHLISGWAGELPSAGYDLTNKGNLIWSSLMPMCQQTLRGEPLSAAPAFCFIGSQKLCLIRVTYSPGPPRNVSSTYQHLAKWSGKAKINIPAKTHNSKILIDSEAEHAKMLRRIARRWSWLPRSPHSAAKRASPILNARTFGSPSHYSSIPCSHVPICCVMIMLRLIFEVWSQEV